MAKTVPADKTTTKRLPTFGGVLPYILIIGGVIGIICSLVLIYDQIRIWETPNYIPACNLNPVVSCGNVINSKQGDIFGIPGPIWGLIAFPVLLTTGVVMLAGAKLKRWYWQGLEAGAAVGAVFALWLFILSLYKVHALCPFCLTVDAVVYTSFWYITLANLRAGHIFAGRRWQPVITFLTRHHIDILILWFLIIFIWVMHHFWYYYGHHL